MNMRRLAIRSAVLFALSLPGLTRGADKEIDPASLIPCPYSQAEIAKDLGFEVEPGIVSDVSSAEIRDVGCVYPVKNSFLALAVRQVWDTNQTSEPLSATAPGTRGVPGDPDGAVWQADKTPDSTEEKPHLKLKYKRGKVSTTVDLYGSYFKEEVMAPKLEKLRRVP